MVTDSPGTPAPTSILASTFSDATHAHPDYAASNPLVAAEPALKKGRKRSFDRREPLFPDFRAGPEPPMRNRLAPQPLNPPPPPPFPIADPNPAQNPTSTNPPPSMDTPTDPLKPIACPRCPTRFQRLHDMYRHLRTVHAEKRPFTCDLCGMSFARKDS
ncbi:hypothetical protein HDU96_002930, partial [Phlyctochytrium bullatum]